ncbi:MAG: YncE family protein [Deltaproteobacteria bacterium]|nr:YncE family protein [Deltaproteobacteria bacterium]MBI3390781.1 YncE family protein [Deltaproteobacteria bacterium]
MKLARSWVCASVSVVLAVVALVNEPAEANDCIYVGGQKGISVIDAQTRSVVAMIPEPVIGTIAIDHARLRAYAASDSILEVDLQTNTVTATIPFPCGVFPGFQVVVSPDGSHLYILGYDISGESKLVAADIRTGTAYSPPVNLHANNGEPLMDITPDGKFLYVARPPFGVSVVDTATFTIAAEVSGFPRGAFAYSVVITPDGTRAYTIDGGNLVSVIDTATNAVIDRIRMMNCRGGNCGTYSLAVSPDSRYVYAVNYTDESIGAIDTLTNTELYTSPYPRSLADPTAHGAVAMHPVFMAVSPDGQTLAVTHDYFDSVRDFNLLRPNFLWIVHAYTHKVEFSDSPNPVFFSRALAIASVPGGCAGAPIACVGDCDGLGTVTVDELVEGVAMALGEQSVATCAALDANRDDAVTVDELIRAVHNALNGCTVETPTPIPVPVCPSLTPTQTRMPTPTATYCNGCPPSPTPTRTFPP